MSDDTTLRIERLIDAPPEAVFHAWTTKEAMEEWYARRHDDVARVIELDLRVGGRYRIEWGPAGEKPYVENGVYLELDPPRQLAGDRRRCERPTATPWADTTVTVVFEEEDGKTRLTLVHENFPSHERARQRGRRLARLHRPRRAAGYWHTRLIRSPHGPLPGRVRDRSRSPCSGAPGGVGRPAAAPRRRSTQRSCARSTATRSSSRSAAGAPRQCGSSAPTRPRPRIPASRCSASDRKRARTRTRGWRPAGACASRPTPRSRDKYGRLLAYVYVDGTRYDDELLRLGYARLLIIPPNGTHARPMLEAELAARAERRGLWGAC